MARIGTSESLKVFKRGQTYISSLFKTFTEMSDPLSKSAIDLAQRRNPTVRVLIENDLLGVISDSQVKGNVTFKLQNASVGGKVVLTLSPADWQQLEEQHVCGRVFGKKAKL